MKTILRTDRNVNVNRGHVKTNVFNQSRTRINAPAEETPISENFRLLEDGDTRALENGDLRILE